MTSIALNLLTTTVPHQWLHLKSGNVRRFDWASTNDVSECNGCRTPLNQHLWRVRSADGSVVDCGVADQA